MNILSLFDGYSGAQLALTRANLPISNYYASEIDPYAIQVTQNNFPNTKQIGDITKLTKKQLKKLDIDILIGGSPCQGFSFAGKGKGAATIDGVNITTLKQYKKLKKQGFEFDGQSYLFWEYVRVWKIVKPKFWLLENVRVSKEWLPMFNDTMGVEPILINSALVSAQNRPRFYWTNIPNIEQPKDKEINLQDILDTKLSIKIVDVCTNGYGVCGSIRPAIRANIIAQSDRIRISAKPFHTMECTSGFNDNKVALTKSMTLRASNHAAYLLDDIRCVFRKFTVAECEKLQTLPVGYTKGVSTTQRKRMIGNGFTVDVIAHILKGY